MADKGQKQEYKRQKKEEGWQIADRRRKMKTGYGGGYEKLEIYKKAHQLALEIHKMSLKLPNFELYEEGSQIRRASKSISSCIVEGFALRNYKKEFVHYLYHSYASCQETKEHVLYIYETKSLKEEDLYRYFINGYEELSKMIFAFISSVKREHKSRK